MNITGAQIVIECLKEQQITTVFGYPGGTILNIYDELYKQREAITHILTSHEQGAVHAADGYSRSSGKVGVVLATSGPGATNLVTGIATAYMDSVPLVAITCNVPSHLLAKDSFQEVDILGITMSITKHNYIVRTVEELAQTIREAFAIAKSGRCGPVLIDIPKEITALKTDFTPMKLPDLDLAFERFTKVTLPCTQEIESAADLINKSKKPLLYVGGGVVAANASQQVLELAEKINAPVAVSLMGKSAFSSKHDLCCGLIGMHGTKAANTAVNQCDLLIVLGARFSDRVISDAKKFASQCKILQIDIDPAEVNKNIRVFLSLSGDAKQILAKINPLLTKRSCDEWNAKVLEWKEHIPSMYCKDLALHPKFVCEKIAETVGEDAFITTEVGQHQMWTAQFYPFVKERTFITSGGLGTMGFGTGAAMGVQAANPNAVVVHIAGDGSFRMNCNELSTIEYYKLPIIIIVVNNGTLGMVRQWQSLFYGKRYSSTTLDRGPDFVKLAHAYGIQGFKATNEGEFAAALQEAVSKRKPSLIEATISMDEFVLPMVPAGKPIDELMLDVSID
ncbi:MAG: biosynthetic-type acetolactate synthase large subunit [Treponemataceae bacterium]